MKKNLGSSLALYPTPAVVVGAMVDGKPMIDASPLVMDCEVVDVYETKTFDSFICKISATYADEGVLTENGKVDYNKLKPVLFEMPTYSYLRTGAMIGKCMSFGKDQK